jgi:hypothetical protein
MTEISRDLALRLYRIHTGEEDGDAAELLAGAESSPSESSASWLSNISDAMVERAARRPADRSYAHRGDLLGPSQSISTSDRFGGHIMTHEDLVSRGGKR